MVEGGEAAEPLPAGRAVQEPPPPSRASGRAVGGRAGQLRRDKGRAGCRTAHMNGARRHLLVLGLGRGTALPKAATSVQDAADPLRARGSGSALAS